MPIDPTARQILIILADLDEDALYACYGLRRTERREGPDAPLDAAIYAWIDAGRPIDGHAEIHDATFDRMENDLSAALGHVAVDTPPDGPKGEPSWEDLLARVARMLPTARREAELYIELREDNANEGETWWFYFPADEAGIAIADAIEELSSKIIGGADYEIVRRDVPGTHVDAFDAREEYETRAAYMPSCTVLRALDLDLWREAESDAEPDPEEDDDTEPMERADEMLSALLYKGGIRRYQVPE